MKDTEIIQHLQNGNIRKAVKGLYGFLPDIRRMVVSKGGRREDADDIFQETLLVLYRKIRETDFALSSSLKTYALGVAGNLWLQELRKRGRAFNVPLEPDLPEDNPDEHRLQLAEKAFMLLGEQCRTILILFYKQRMGMRDIAQRLGFASEQVAKNQKYRCLEKAKSNYAELLQS